MTDQQRLIELLESFGLQRSGPDRPCFTKRGKYLVSADADEMPDEEDLAADSSVSIDNGVGYASFWCSFYFDADGKYVGHGCWE